MGRLRQVNGEVEVARQAEVGRRVGREVAKRTAAGDRESLRKQTDRGLDQQRGRKIKMDR